jgi:hypothetical protein
MRRLNKQAHAGGLPPNRDRHEAGLTKDGGIWRGPSEAVWMKRLLRGAPPPQQSAGAGDALVAHG